MMNQEVSNQQPKGKSKKGCLISIIIFVILSAIVGTCSDSKEKEKEIANVTEVEEIDSVELEIDTVKIKKLAPKFREKKDEFKGISWIEPKTATQYIDQNDIYCYFAIRDGKPENLRLKIQYAADDWLFIKKYIFLIDGKSYPYTPRKVERDNNTRIWEWSDENIEESLELLTVITAAMMDAKEIKIRFEGRQYHKDKTLTPKQIKQITEPLEYFSALTPHPKKDSESESEQ